MIKRSPRAEKGGVFKSQNPVGQYHKQDMWVGVACKHRSRVIRLLDNDMEYRILRTSQEEGAVQWKSSKRKVGGGGGRGEGNIKKTGKGASWKLLNNCEALQKITGAIWRGRIFVETKRQLDLGGGAPNLPRTESLS